MLQNVRTKHLGHDGIRPVILAFERLRQEDCWESEASLGYTIGFYQKKKKKAKLKRQRRRASLSLRHSLHSKVP